MMSTLWTVAAVCLCLGGHPCSETSELKKAIVRMQDLYHVNFVYDSSLEMIRVRLPMEWKNVSRSFT